jgi:O-antigen/teichoic acid export membrane protein
MPTPDEIDDMASNSDLGANASPRVGELPDAQTRPLAESSSRSVGRNASALAVSQLATWVLSTITVWLLPRYLGPEGIGQLGIAGSLWAIAAVFATFGTSQLLITRIAQQRPIAASLTRNVVKLRLALFLLFCPLVALTVWLAQYGTRTAWVVAIGGLGALFGLISNAPVSAMLGLQEMGATAKWSVTNKIVLTASTVGVLLAGVGVLGVSAVQGVVAALFVIVAFRSLRRVKSPTTISSPLSGRRLAHASSGFLAVSAAVVVYQQVDTLVMSVLIGEKPIGWYNAADTVYGSLLFVPVVVGTALFPKLAELHGNDAASATRLFEQSFRSMLLITVPIGIATIVVSPTFVPLIFGKEFHETVPVLQLFGLVIIPTGQAVLLGRYALATDRTRTWALLMTGAIALSIPLDIVLVPIMDDRFGNAAIAGAAAYLVTETLLVLVSVFVLAPAIADRALLVRVLRCSAAGLAMFAASWPLRDRIFLIPGTVAVVVYVVVILALRTLDPEEQELVRRARSMSLAKIQKT